jgi:hypothetical protein
MAKILVINGQNFGDQWPKFWLINGQIFGDQWPNF